MHMVQYFEYSQLLKYMHNFSNSHIDLTNVYVSFYWFMQLTTSYGIKILKEVEMSWKCTTFSYTYGSSYRFINNVAPVHLIHHDLFLIFYKLWI